MFPEAGGDSMDCNVTVPGSLPICLLTVEIYTVTAVENAPVTGVGGDMHLGGTRAVVEKLIALEDRHTADRSFHSLGGSGGYPESSIARGLGHKIGQVVVSSVKSSVNGRIRGLAPKVHPGPPSI